MENLESDPHITVTDLGSSSVIDTPFKMKHGSISKVNQQTNKSTPTQPPHMIRRTLTDGNPKLMVAFTPTKRFPITAVAPNKKIDTNKVIEIVRHTVDL